MKNHSILPRCAKRPRLKLSRLDIVKYFYNAFKPHLGRGVLLLEGFEILVRRLVNIALGIRDSVLVVRRVGSAKVSTNHQ